MKRKKKIDTTWIDLGLNMSINIVNIQNVSVWCYSYVLINSSATFRAQFMKKLSNTEAGLKKRVAYKKNACNRVWHSLDKDRMNNIQTSYFASNWLILYFIMKLQSIPQKKVSNRYG